MKTLMTLGCSYSQIYYHPDPRWSYTWLLKEALGAENLINLSFGGNSPSGCTRTLEWYLRNPLKGMPDFIYVQMPQGQREEYYLSDPSMELFDEVTFVVTNKNNYETMLGYGTWHALRQPESFPDYHRFKRPEDKDFKNDQELIDDMPWEKLLANAGTIWNEKLSFDNKWYEENLFTKNKDDFYIMSRKSFNVQPSWAEARIADNKNRAKDITGFHKLWANYKRTRPEMVHTVRREMVLMQNLAKRHNIPIAFNTTDNVIVPETGEFESWDDRTSIFDSMINWDNFLKYEGINNGSRTFVDEYWDGHPGRVSHERYAEKVIPFVKSLLP
tara:strand:- start:3577 stop:4563 length:987 start_codon:yes stop_codon:yes gene_type:complete